MQFSRLVRAAVAALTFAIVPATASAETLTEALAAAYANNPNIASALLSVHSAAESIALSKAGTRPTIGASADYSRGFSVTGGGNTTTSQSETASVGLSYNQTLFDNFRTDAQIRQAEALYDVARQGLRNAEQNVLLSAATAYMNVVRDTQLVQLRQENVGFLQAQVQSAQDRLQIGEGTRLDVSQAEASLAQAVSSYQSAINNLRISQASYERWVGRSPQNLTGTYRFGPELPTSLDEAMESSNARHPAVLASMAQIESAQHASEAARAAFGPTLNLIGQIGTQGQWSSVSQTGGPAGSSGLSGSVRLSLQVPIYSGGALGAQSRQANIGQIQSEVDAFATRDQVHESVIQAWAGLQTAIAQIESATAAVAASRLSLQGVIDQQEVGQATTLDVLNARANLTGVQESLISAQSQRIVAAFSLLAAAGKLNPIELGLPVEIFSADGYRQNVQDLWQEITPVQSR